MPDFGIVSIPAIVVISYFVGKGVKAYQDITNDKILPIVGAVGGVLGIAGYFIMPDFPAPDVITALAVGIVSGMSATWVDQIKKQKETK